MESHSGPFHTRKLFSRNSFSKKNPYEGVWTGQKKPGAPSSPPEDVYREIFKSYNQEADSTIPIIDLSGLDDRKGSSNLKNQEPDYSEIFGGLQNDGDELPTYEELFGEMNVVKNSPEEVKNSPEEVKNSPENVKTSPEKVKNSPGKKVRTTSERRQTSQDSEDLFEVSNSSSQALKKFNMSYHQTTQRSKDGSDMTTHVAQLHDVPGFTFIDEIKMSSSHKDEVETQISSTANGIHPKIDARPEVKDDKKAYEQTFESEVKSKSRYSRSVSFLDDELSKTYDINIKPHSSKLPSPSIMEPNLENHQARYNESDSWAPHIDVSESNEELNVNSVAAVSVAALKKAIETAQESIRIAKESTWRKDGHRSFSDKRYEDCLKVEGHEATYKNVEGFDVMERANACKDGVVHSDFKDRGNLLVAKKVADKIHGKVSKFARQHERPPLSAPELKESERVSVAKEVQDETTGRNQESVENFEASTWSSEHLAVEKGSAEISAFRPPFSSGNILESTDYHDIKVEVSTVNEIREEQEEVLEERDSDNAENENGHGSDCCPDVNAKILEEVSQRVENELKEFDVSNEREKEDTHKEEAPMKLLEELHELEINDDMEESQVRLEDEMKFKRDANQKEEGTEKLFEERDAYDEQDSEETLKERCEWAGDGNVVTEDYIYEERESTASGTDGNEENRGTEMLQKVSYKEIFGVDFDGFNHGTSSITADDTCKFEINDNNMEKGEEANDSGESPKVTLLFSEVEEKAEAGFANRMLEKEISGASGRTSTEDNVVDKTIGIEESVKEEVEISFSRDEKKIFTKRAHWDLKGSHLPNIPKEKEQPVEIKDQYIRSQYRECTRENLHRTMEDKKDIESEVKKVEEKKQLKEVDEERKRQREQEKDRIAVERVVREARERAFAEARERAERAAVERATSEVQQKLMAEARKVEKAKIRAERAAVERATTEARERALEKAMSQTINTSERLSEKLSRASSDTGMWQSTSTDLNGSSGASFESAQRSKAKLEKHNRIMERAAKALAEKEKRDLLVQREQAERTRLAETLDAEIKRWSSGKEGNLRALLSTLQYILGSSSGWQPVSLTDIITSSAVKKAYRKATLVVHPDKLQQRGASIHHKYICEKVFDLLKAAWNKFNLEEK